MTQAAQAAAAQANLLSVVRPAVARCFYQQEWECGPGCRG